MNNEDKLLKVKGELIFSQPFFASIALRKPITLSHDVETAAINLKTGEIKINPDFWEPLTSQQGVFLLCHEVLHWAGNHLARRGSRDAGQWNVAGDAYINDLLSTEKIGQPIEGGVYQPGASKASVEELYQQQQQQQQQASDGKGGSKGAYDPDADPMSGDCEGEQLSEAEAAEIAAEVKVAITQAATIAKKAGKLPVSIARMVEELVQVDVPWYEQLAHLMSEKVKSDYNWSRPNKRYTNAIMPSLDGVSMGEVAVCIDTSVSINQQQINLFLSHVNAIVQSCDPVRTTIVWCDATVQGVESFEQGDVITSNRVNPKGGGGTSFDPALRYVRENLPEAAVCIYLTDGYASKPDVSSIPDASLVWCCTTDIPCHYGETVRTRLTC